MSGKSPGRLQIPQWAVVSRTVTAWDIARDEYDAETGRTRTDLTTAIIYFTVKNAAGTIVIAKDSNTPAEITILSQLVAATKGQAKIYFLEADTSALVVGTDYWFDCWVAVDGKEEPIVDRGLFTICESITQISVV